MTTSASWKSTRGITPPNWRSKSWPLGLAVAAAAKVLGVSRPTLSTLLNGHSDLSGEMALRLEKAFGVKMNTLMRMQNAFDIAEARKKAGRMKVKRYVAADLSLG
jgi:addiction module HigA family antidote